MRSVSKPSIDRALEQFLPYVQVLSHGTGVKEPRAMFRFLPQTSAAVAWRQNLSRQSTIFPLDLNCSDRERPEWAVRSYLLGKKSTGLDNFLMGFGVIFGLQERGFDKGFGIASVVVCRGPNLSRTIDPTVPEEIAGLKNWIFGTSDGLLGIPDAARKGLLGQIKSHFKSLQSDFFHVLVGEGWNPMHLLGPDVRAISEPFPYKDHRFSVVAVPTFRWAARARAAKPASKA